MPAHCTAAVSAESAWAVTSAVLGHLWVSSQPMTPLIHQPHCDICGLCNVSPMTSACGVQMDSRVMVGSGVASG